MKRFFAVAIFMLAGTLAAFSQAKKPTLMVVPSDPWCTENGYMFRWDNQGVWEILPDYDLALKTNSNLALAISKIGEMMAERGFPLKDLAANLRSLRNDAAEESLTSSSSGDMLAESPLDQLKKVAKADIWIHLTYTVNSVGPKNSLTFNMQGIDAYTNKQVAAASGTSQPSFSVELPVLIEEGVLSHIDQFNNQLQAHFDDLFENGREISLVCRRWSGSPVDFETEFDGDELGFLIEDWLAENTVSGRFSTSDASENRMVFEQVRIPMQNERGRALDARTWANDLRKWLMEKYGIEAKLSTKGLGQAIITIGEK